MTTEPETKKDSNRAEDKGTTNKYPHEKVLFTQGGVRFSYGDEPGKQFVRILHPSGTYTEIYPDGRMVTMSVGDNKVYNKGGVTLSVDENMDIHIAGHSNFKVAGGANIEVAGNAGVAIGGDTALLGMGNLNLNVKNAYLGVRGDLGISVEGSTAIKTAGVTYIESGGDVNMKSSGNINQDGSQMHLNSGKAASAGGGSIDA